MVEVLQGSMVLAHSIVTDSRGFTWVDGNLATYWRTARSSSTAEWILVDLGALRPINKVV